jgi:2-keto-4-pentenoate hydratase/2-oxohepta-3-ene-1,7-dioic acid hydratase in catechol pathway
MKLYTFRVPSPVGPLTRIGAGLEGRIVDLNLATAARLRDAGEPDWRDYADFLVPSDMITFLERGPKARKAAADAMSLVAAETELPPEVGRVIHDIGEVHLMAPVPRPNIVWDSMVFLEHVKMGRPVIPDVFFEWPPYFAQSGAIVSGPHDPIVAPRFTEQLDFELEFGAYIGTAGINIAEEDAERHIAGFTIYNDVSARDVQFREMEMMLGPAKGKNFEGANIMGPCLVTPDELDPGDLRMVARINGEVVVDDHSSSMHYSFGRIVSWISEEQYLYPGDFIASGTCDHGTCQMSQLQRWLREGDVVEFEIEGIGVIRNQVVAAEERGGRR